MSDVSERRILKHDVIARVEAAVSDVQNGKIVIISDDMHRENECDMMVAAAKVTPDIIAKMVRHGSGIVCLSMTIEHADRLGLQLVFRRNVELDSTAFLYSIDAFEGITTGVSAKDRAVTILKAADLHSDSTSFVTPGHVFPLLSHKEGLRGRRGHTEASIELTKLAGLPPIAVICENMEDDGSMSTVDGIKKALGNVNLSIVSVEDIIIYMDYIAQL